MRLMKVGASRNGKSTQGSVLGRNGAQPQRSDVVAAGQRRCIDDCMLQAKQVSLAKSGATCRPLLIAAIWKALAKPLKLNARANEMTWPP